MRSVRARVGAGAAVAALALASVGAGAVRPNPQGFRFAGGATGCAYLVRSGQVACWNRTLGMGFRLARHGEPKALPVSLAQTALPRRALAQGTVWRRGGVACVSRDAAITCTNRSGAALVVSSDAVAALATPLGP